MSDNRFSATPEPISEEVSTNQIKKSDNKNKSKFSILKKNIKKNFKMSSRQKDEEKMEGIVVTKKKKSKKPKDKFASQPMPSTSVEQDPSDEERTLTEPTRRKLSLDKLYPNVKVSKEKDISKERRATTPDLTALSKSLNEELKRSGKDELLVPEKPNDSTNDGESELSEEYRTPACQSPEGSFVEEISQNFPSNSETSRDAPSEDSSGSDTSLGSAIQSGTKSSDYVHPNTPSIKNNKPEVFASNSSLDNLVNDVDSKYQNTSTFGQPDLQMDSVLSPKNSGSGSTPNVTDTNKSFSHDENLSPLTASQEAPQAIGEKCGEDIVEADKLAGGTKSEPVSDATTMKKRDIFSPPELENQASGEKRECLFKILVIGELGTGKTSIIKRYVHEFFSQHYRATIGVDFALKVLSWDQDTVIRLQLWDIAGQERFGNMTRVYYKEAVGAFIVFDVTRSATFDAVLKWKQDLDSKVQLPNGSPIPCVLLANKCDQPKEGSVNNPEKIEQFCKENNFSDWFETSAKENINIDLAAKGLVTKILQNDKLSQNGKESSKDSSKFPLDGKSIDSEKKTCAC